MMTTRSLRPLDRAVVVKSWERASIMLDRVIRAMKATTKAARVSEGRMTCFQLPVPPAGSQLRTIENTTTSIKPSQKTGIEMPKRAVEVTT